MLCQWGCHIPIPESPPMFCNAMVQWPANLASVGSWVLIAGHAVHYIFYLLFWDGVRETRGGSRWPWLMTKELSTLWIDCDRPSSTRNGFKLIELKHFISVSLSVEEKFKSTNRICLFYLFQLSLSLQWLWRSKMCVCWNMVSHLLDNWTGYYSLVRQSDNSTILRRSFLGGKGTEVK